MLTKQMILDGLQYYKWHTDYPLSANSESMNDLLENELPCDAEIVEIDANWCIVEMQGDKYEITTYGDGDFCNHVAEIHQYITEKIKTFEDAAKATGRPLTIDLSSVPEDLREYFEGQYQMMVIAEALNEGWKPNWSDSEEPKYLPYFLYNTDDKEGVSSGFVFYNVCYYYSRAGAGYGLRLCFRTRKLAKYAGKQFIDIWNKILLK